MGQNMGIPNMAAPLFAFPPPKKKRREERKQKKTHGTLKNARTPHLRVLVSLRTWDPGTEPQKTHRLPDLRPPMPSAECRVPIRAEPSRADPMRLLGTGWCTWCPRRWSPRGRPGSRSRPCSAPPGCGRAWGRTLAEPPQTPRIRENRWVSLVDD